MTFLGRKDKYDQIDCFTFACADEQLAWMKAATDELKASFDYNTLTPTDKDSYDLWVYQYERAAAGVPYRNNGFVFDQMNGLQSFAPTFLMQFHAVSEESDARALIARYTRK